MDRLRFRPRPYGTLLRPLGREGRNGIVSIDLAVSLKLLLLFLDDVKSERELMRRVACRLEYLWSLDFSMRDEVPDHSVLSEARRRWGAAVSEELSVQTAEPCVEAGPVAGERIRMDSTLVDANASNDSVIKGSPVLIEALPRAAVLTANPTFETPTPQPNADRYWRSCASVSRE